ncbi:MAG: helix-turn-helix domain-containing protein [Candidatus Dormiibacterota bacterium]
MADPEVGLPVLSGVGPAVHANGGEAARSQYSPLLGKAILVHASHSATLPVPSRGVRVEADVVTLSEAAGLVGRSPKTVRRWLGSGELSSVGRGRQDLVSRSELEAFATARGCSLPLSLAAWAKQPEAAVAATRDESLASARDLVLADRVREA